MGPRTDEATIRDPLPDVVITADAHVGEPEDLRRRLPEAFRDTLPEFGVDADGNLEFKVKGKVVYGEPGLNPTELDLLRGHCQTKLSLPVEARFVDSSDE